MPTIEPDWDRNLFGDLLLSIGGGAHQRPLLPAQIADALGTQVERGVTHDTLARTLHLDSSAMIGRFTRLNSLPRDVSQAVGWGRSVLSINLTQAQEIARLPDAEAMRRLAQLTIEHRLSGGEVRSCVQVALRRVVDADEAVETILRTRPSIERRYAYLGKLDDDVAVAVDGLMPDARAAALATTLDELGLGPSAATLTTQGFTLVFDEAGKPSLEGDGLEAALNRVLRRVLEQTEGKTP